MLKEKTLFEDIDRVQIAIDFLKKHEPNDGYYLAFSGGKDSEVIKQLAILSGVKFEANYEMTTIDPPEVVRHIKINHPDVIINRPEKSFFQLVQTRGFPLRQSRWCCELLKEKGGEGRIVITGIRAEESSKRKKRKLFEDDYKSKAGKKILNIILEWTEADVWQFIEDQNIKYCELYDRDGVDRIGCLFCPMASKKKRINELKQYPKFKKAFINAFEKLYKLRKEQGNKSVDRWSSGEDMFYWWVYEVRTKEIPDQTVMFE